MSKLGPRRYGERLLVAGEIENPVRVLHQHVSLDQLSRDQLDALEAFAQSLVERGHHDTTAHDGRHRRGAA
jgi:hypothetical protein